MAKVKWTKEQHQALDSFYKNAKRLGQMPKVIAQKTELDDDLLLSIKERFICPKCKNEFSSFYKRPTCKKCGEVLEYKNDS